LELHKADDYAQQRRASHQSRSHVAAGPPDSPKDPGSGHCAIPGGLLAGAYAPVKLAKKQGPEVMAAAGPFEVMTSTRRFCR
jgi:hypothetical protein